MTANEPSAREINAAATVGACIVIALLCLLTEIARGCFVKGIQ